MTRPWHIWACFGLCLVIVLAAMGWTSLTVLRLEEQSRKQAAREENVRLALWRMDSALAPLLAQETAVPYFAYGSFYPAGRAYGDMFNGARSGEALYMSPLLSESAPHALLYFQFDPDGQINSPQVPPKTRMAMAQSGCVSPHLVSEARERVAELKTQVSRETLLAMLPQAATPTANNIALFNVVVNDNSKEQKESKDANETNSKEAQSNPVNNAESPQQQLDGNAFKQSKGNTYLDNKSSTEFQNRKRNVDEAQGYATVNNGMNTNAAVQNFVPAQTMQQIALNRHNDPPSNVSQGMMKPVWAGSALVLARRVSVGKKEYVQGCWLDWPWLQERLVSDVRDLLPDARLEPAPDGATERASNMLAALPVKLTPGDTIPLEPMETLSPVRLSLLIAWTFALLAAGAVAALLFGAVSLSERRGAFVSAVTHELRTPLTTFRMYAEMLAGGMVPNEAARQSYLNTLTAEAARLTHLVENVLAYARLERSSARSRVERVDLSGLLDAVKPRLAERAAQAGMALELSVDPQAASTFLTTDVSAVEQILFNLVDNACKYAAVAEPNTIRIVAARDGRWARVSVADNGPGFSSVEMRKLFQPFSKSARQAAHSAPGVGLGLALSKRLARDLKGDLKLNRAEKKGACFDLLLPLPS